jgi:AcrR family transcriptional regulator
MSPRPKLITPQGSLQEAIITVAWKQIGESGAASLSLRAIARELNITAPAIYNYYPSRDDLVTALIVQAYTDFGDIQMAAVQAVSEGDPVGRLLASGRAYRAWALTYPERFHLIFGTPIPGYVAPEEKTLPVAARSMAALLGALEILHTQGRLQMLPRQEINPEQQILLEERRQMGGEILICSPSLYWCGRACMVLSPWRSAITCRLTAPLRIPFTSMYWTRLSRSSSPEPAIACRPHSGRDCLQMGAAPLYVCKSILVRQAGL